MFLFLKNNSYRTFSQIAQGTSVRRAMGREQSDRTPWSINNAQRLLLTRALSIWLSLDQKGIKSHQWLIDRIWAEDAVSARCPLTASHIEQPLGGCSGVPFPALWSAVAVTVQRLTGATEPNWTGLIGETWRRRSCYRANYSCFMLRGVYKAALGSPHLTTFGKIAIPNIKTGCSPTLCAHSVSQHVLITT